jgi:lipoprotein-anchoring transpeptidase ErfK/SrfK
MTRRSRRTVQLDSRPRRALTNVTVATFMAVAVTSAGLVSGPLGIGSTAAAATTTTKPKQTAIPAKDLVVPPAPQAGVVPAKTMVAAALGRFVNVFDSPSAKKAAVVMDNRKNFSGRHVFVVIGKGEAAQGQAGWLKVLVPIRPNGRTGWVKTSEVGVFEHDWAIVVRKSAFTLEVYKAGQLVQTEKVAIGQDKYPTPTGMFFTRELARPANAKGAYGPYAFGLSAYSNVLTRFGRGDGQIGIHGTNQPAAIGSKASHGCIRLPNTAITKLAKTLPQGVPVDIRD